MCGFVTTITPRTGSLLAHRGPDGYGVVGAVSLPWASVSLEMTRLSVVDRRSIPVPFDFRKSAGVVLAYNGEIYNWKTLRAELSDGSSWETDCDAEVIARAWRRWGPGMLNRFNGMWGLCLVDTIRGEVFLARDRAGEKPLYYALVGTGLAFASEIKALPVKLEEAPCPDADVFEFDCLETTPFRGVRRLGPGQFVHLTRPEDFSRGSVTWWRLPEISYNGTPREMLIDEAEALVVDAIKIRVPDEVPFAVQVSGGLDSAIIQTVAKAEHTYTVTFPEDGVDNLTLARLVAPGTLPVTFGYADLVEMLPKIAYHLDTPATWTAVCQWFMNQKIAADGAVVVLSGEGADEIFFGYARYRLLYWMDRARGDRRLAGYEFARGRVYGSDDEIIARMIDRSQGSARVNRILTQFENVRPGSLVEPLVERAARLDFYTTMQVLLRMGDKMAAAHSLENRSPFLDYRIMELAARMPVSMKIDEWESKAVLCEVARRLDMPREIVDQPTKRGLFLPWARWTGGQGWDRSSFVEAMRAAWCQAFKLTTS